LCDLLEIEGAGLRKPGGHGFRRLNVCAEQRHESLDGLMVRAPKDDRCRELGVALEFADAEISDIAVVASVEGLEETQVALFEIPFPGAIGGSVDSEHVAGEAVGLDGVLRSGSFGALVAGEIVVHSLTVPTPSETRPGLVG